jgi:hypothetical protein
VYTSVGAPCSIRGQANSYSNVMLFFQQECQSYHYPCLVRRVSSVRSPFCATPILVLLLVRVVFTAPGLLPLLRVDIESTDFIAIDAAANFSPHPCLLPTTYHPAHPHPTQAPSALGIRTATSQKSFVCYLLAVCPSNFEITVLVPFFPTSASLTLGNIHGWIDVTWFWI